MGTMLHYASRVHASTLLGKVDLVLYILCAAQLGETKREDLEGGRERSS
jgi:hypothetical protein